MIFITFFKLLFSDCFTETIKDGKVALQESAVHKMFVNFTVCDFFESSAFVKNIEMNNKKTI